jgi:hypothetical protein
VRRYVKPVVLTLIGVFVAMQLVPYGWQHPNPEVTQDAPWPSARSREIAVRACYDCHSNETEWPVYSYLAPMSWLVRRDVDEGRDALNFSEWDQEQDEIDDGRDVVEDGSMPPSQYLLIHRDANLSDEEERILADALASMEEGGVDHSGRGRGGDDEDDDDREDDDHSGGDEDRSGSSSGPG